MLDKVDLFGFESQGRMEQKLSRTVVRHLRDFVYIVGFNKNKNNTFDIVGISNKNPHVHVNIPLEEIDYSTPALSYFFSPYYKKCLSAERSTMRQYRGGLPPDMVVFRDILTNNHEDRHGKNLSIILDQHFVDMLNGEYPNINECLDLLKKDKAISVPFKRFHWIEKIHGNYMVHFKKKPIIFLSSKGSVINDFQDSSGSFTLFHQNTVIKDEIDQIKRNLGG